MAKVAIFVVLALVAAAYADVQPAIDAIKATIDTLNIPDDRKATYKTAADNSKECLEGVAAGAGAERIQEYITKLQPVVAACSKEIEGIAVDQVEERRTKFQECAKEKVHSADSNLDEKQKESLVKIKECLQQALTPA